MSFRTLKECIKENKNVEKNPKQYCEMVFPELNQITEIVDVATGVLKFRKKDKKLHVPLSTVKDIMKQSRVCINKFPNLQNHKNACEVGIIPSKSDNYTLHTHTHSAKIDYPSPKDVETTNKWKKEFLCIAESITGRLVCYSNKDNFMKPISDKKVI